MNNLKNKFTRGFTHSCIKYHQNLKRTIFMFGKLIFRKQKVHGHTVHNNVKLWCEFVKSIGWPSVEAWYSFGERQMLTFSNNRLKSGTLCDKATWIIFAVLQVFFSLGKKRFSDYRCAFSKHKKNRNGSRTKNNYHYVIVWLLILKPFSVNVLLILL